MTTPTVPLLSDAERAVLAGLAEIIAPAWKTMPSAADIALSQAPIDRALQARPDLLLPLRTLLAEFAGADPGIALDRLRHERPADLAKLMQAVAGAYYMHERVRDALGYKGQRRREPDQRPG